MKNSLFFNAPAEKWEHYLPLGNGRLGCMVKAHPCNEVIQLNEEEIWSGGPQDRLNPDTKNNLNTIRSLVREGRVLEAQRLGFEAMSGMGFNDRVYQTAGDFKIDFFSEVNSGIAVGWPLAHKFSPECLNTYKSELNLDDACAVISYKDDAGVTFTRRVWASAVDDVIFMHVSCDKSGALNFSGYLDRGIWSDCIKAEDGFIFLEDSHGIPFCAGVGVVARGGKYGVRGLSLYGEGCDEALFFIDIKAWKWNSKARDKKAYDKLIRKNTWSGECKAHLAKVRDYVRSRGVSVVADDYLGWHIVEWRSYWERFWLQIGEVSQNADDSNSVAALPTPELLQKAAPSNVELVNLYAAFSRYLLISGSRKPGVMPLTLQGLWNCYMDPPWGSKYTININAQMNYWPVNMAGLADCEMPLFMLLERAYERGVVAARELYGCRGYVLHHNTDFWGDAAPQDAWIPGTYWVLGAAWLATHIIEHFEYSMDKAFLARYYYLMHEAALFFVDFLVPCEDGAGVAADGKPYLVINPSLSPENSYVTKTGEVGAFSEGCEMDNMILEHLFRGIQKAKKVLGSAACNQKGKAYSYEDFTAFDYVLSHLKKPSLNSDGSLMEWNREVEEVEPGHRHISHLYGLYPGHTITVEGTPELAEACKKTLKKRLSNGGGHTGWSQAWIINFYAQLGMGNEALSSIVKLFQHSTLPNLLDNHPPFQIDGNFGTLAGIIRLLVQSEFDAEGNVVVKLLPALPDEPAWQSGSVRGVAIKGGYTLDFEWKDGKVVRRNLTAGPNCVDEKRIIIQGF